MAIHKNATAISKLLKMPLQFLQTLKNTTPDFEKCHWKWHEMAFFKVWKLQCISRKHQIWSGIYQINPKQK